MKKNNSILIYSIVVILIAVLIYFFFNQRNQMNKSNGINDMIEGNKYFQQNNFNGFIKILSKQPIKVGDE